MENKRISLNGKWEMEYVSGEPYEDEKEPQVSGCIFHNAVPAYWEDMVKELSETFLYQRLNWNPKYTLQRYPIAGYLPDMQLPTVVGCFLYRKTVVIEELSSEAEAELYLGGVHNAVSAWINGEYLGRFEGFSAPISFTVPKDVLKLGENTITLAVSNTRLKGYKERPISGCTTRAANNYTGGIWGDVELRFHYSSLRYASVTVEEDLSSFSINFNSPLSSSGEIKIKDGQRELYSTKLEKGDLNHAVSTEGFTLWSVNNPKRYTLVISCGKDRLEKKFGIRRLVAEGRKLKLNGEYFMARGICEHGYYPLTVHPPRDKGYYRKIILTLKELGFNFIRFHTTVPMAEYMEAADELGMLMEVETPNNTTYEEWVRVINYTKQYTAPVMYSSGNEMIVDEDYIEHLRACAKLVHEGTDSLFSPISAMRGIEYFDFGPDPVEEPFKHNPRRLNAVSEFSDVYNSYPNGQFSYISASADPEFVDKCYSIYNKPILSHEICINGTYCDLSLKDRYRGSRIGETELYSSVEKHLSDKGLLSRAPVYYKNSSEWQRRLRKQCFESVRRAEVSSGYDYLGDIDHHWHTFGYCVGMMNEFYELKPGETVENVRRYNSDAVLLCDLPYNVNFECKEKASFPILISNYGSTIEKAQLNIVLKSEERVFFKKSVAVSDIASGEITALHTLDIRMPESEKPIGLKLSVTLISDEKLINNEWELYVFPKASSVIKKKKLAAENLAVYEDISAEKLISDLKRGKDVLLFGTGPFASLKTSFQIALAGRTAGHLATVIEDTPLMEDFPHQNFCGWQFRSMLDGGKAVVLDIANVPFEPLVEAVSTYKYAHKEALIFEYKIGNGRLLVASFNFDDKDPGARWLKSHIVSYTQSESFSPKHELSFDELSSLFSTNPIFVEENTNMARNTNDITA